MATDATVRVLSRDRRTARGRGPIDSLHCMACADVDSATACAQEPYAELRDELVQVAKDAAIGSSDGSATETPVCWTLQPRAVFAELTGDAFRVR